MAAPQYCGADSPREAAVFGSPPRFVFVRRSLRQAYLCALSSHRPPLDPASSSARPGSRLLFSVALLIPLALIGPVGLAVRLGVLVVLLGLSALFSGSEVALFSLSPAQREGLSDDESRAARRIRWMLDRPRSLLITILLLNTVANVGAAILSAVLTLEAARRLGWSETVALVLEVAALTFVLLVVSEVAPKLAASRNPVAFAKRSSILLYPLARFLAPLSTLMALGTAWLQKHLRSPARPLSSEDVRTMADVGEAHGSLEEEERALIHSILEFGETAVREVMISRVDVIALPDTATLGEALQLIRDSGHSRLPLFREHLDNILGVIYAKDLLPYLGSNGGHDGNNHERPIEWETLARRPRFVPLSKKLDDMLEDFQEHRTHMAIVVDEYGGTAGLVTLEDLLEEVVGEIWDELDTPEETLIRAAGPSTWRVEARIDLDDLMEALGIDIDTEQFDFETLGGLVFDLAGEIPSPGDELSYGRLQLRVESVEENRIREVLVTLLPETETTEEK